MIRAKDLAIGYDKTICSGISFSIKKGSLACLLGPNGIGKTSLLKTILGINKRKSGSIEIEKSDISSLSLRQLYKKMAYVPQSHNTAFSFKVIDVVVMGRAVHMGSFALPKKSDESIATRSLETLGIGHLSDKDFSILSGGEKQLVLIARALAQESNIIVMDEPCSNLDYGNQIRLMDTLKRLSKAGKTVIFSTHNPNHALMYCDSAMIMDSRRNFFFGHAKDTVTEERLSDIYNIQLDIRRLGPFKRICVPRI